MSKVLLDKNKVLQLIDKVADKNKEIAKEESKKQCYISASCAELRGAGASQVWLHVNEMKPEKRQDIDSLIKKLRHLVSELERKAYNYKNIKTKDDGVYSRAQGKAFGFNVAAANIDMIIDEMEDDDE